MKISGIKLKQIRMKSGKTLDEILDHFVIPANEYFAIEHGILEINSKIIIDKYVEFFKCRDTDLLVG